MANLYELEESYRNLMEVLETTEEEYQEIIKNSLEEIQQTLDKKAENIIKYSKNLRAEAFVLKEEAKRLSEKAKSHDKKAENLERYLFESMKYAKKDSIKTGIFDISIKKNPVSLKIIDESLVPKDYFKVKLEIDKITLKNILKNGEVIPGVELEQKEALKVK